MGSTPHVTAVKWLVALAAALGVAVASAQPYPNKPIRIIVPYPAGGTSDILARALGPGITAALGQPVVVENKPGSTGNVGADLVAKSPPDGYTVLLADIGSLAISPSIFPDAAVRSGEGFRARRHGRLLAASAGGDSHAAGEGRQGLIALAKAKPGTLNFAVSGIGGANHLAGVDFALRTGIKWAYIPYKGGAQAITDVVGGQADVLFNGMLATYPQVQGGKFKALAVSSSKRFAAAPAIPTVAESGLPGFETGSFQGIVAPAGHAPGHRQQAAPDRHPHPRHAGDAGAPRQRRSGDAARARRRSSAPSSATRRRAGRRSSRIPARNSNSVPVAQELQVSTT